MSVEKNILVTGSKGQLGNEIRVLSPSFDQFRFTFIDMEEIDLAEEGSIKSYFKDKTFDAIIHCAAYTAVDLAEDQPDLAFKVNSESVRLLAEIARDKGMRIFHVSTDYVFEGSANKPITEEQQPAPLSVYGHSKLQGEQHLLSILPNAYIIRTAWVYSTFGKNFVKTMMTLGRQRPELNVVADQIGSPTYAHDLAHTLLTIADAALSGKNDQPGIYHYSNDGVISWYDFAHFIIRYYNLPCTVKPIRSSEYKTKAARPEFSVLDKRKIRETFGIEVKHWHDSLLKCLEKGFDQ